METTRPFQPKAVLGSLLSARQKIVLRNLLESFLWMATFLLSLVETPCFLLRNRGKIFKNRLLLPFYICSFGHSLSGLDFSSRLFYGNGVTVILVPHPRSNPHLHRLFEKNMTMVVYTSILGVQSRLRDSAKHAALRFYLCLLSACFQKYHVLDFHEVVYKTVSLSENRLKRYDNERKTFKTYTDYTGYIRLLRDNVGRPPQMPDDFMALCRGEIQRVCPDFYDKPVVTVQIRTKGGVGSQIDNLSRNGGPVENYLPAVEWLGRNGFYVITTGDFDNTPFRTVPGFLDLSGLNVDPAILNLHHLACATLYVGQQSGPLLLRNAMKKLCVVADAGDLWCSGFFHMDVTLFKVYVDAQGREVTLKEMYRNHRDIVMGRDPKDKGLTLRPNTPHEILSAVQEGVFLIRNNLRETPEMEQARRDFLALTDPEILTRHQGLRPAMINLDPEYIVPL
ncbi:MAG: TIGR04372 family glycosyltransferase [Verrucomicrobiae bacterium]|nr:TIGR04372 family glycosyltransferase [Verrucomicrobiae bacterium]